LKISILKISVSKISIFKFNWLKNTESAESKKTIEILDKVEDYTKATVELANYLLLTFQQIFLH
jgi:hypothetical protein